MKLHKKLFNSLILILFLFFGIKSVSQNYSSAIGVLGGYAEDGYGGLLNYNYYIDRSSFVQVGAYVSANSIEEYGYKIKYSDISLNFGYFGAVYKNRFKTVTVNLGGGAIAGYEAVNNGSTELPNGALVLDRSKFIYGAFASVESEIYINNQWSFILKYNQFYHANSDLGKLTLFVGGGFRYFLF